MKLIKITNEEIIKGLMEYTGFCLTDEESKVLKAIKEGKTTVDCKGDIVADTDLGRYWVTTTPIISRFNKNEDYDVSLEYKIHKNSKYNEAIMRFVA